MYMPHTKRVREHPSKGCSHGKQTQGPAQGHQHRHCGPRQQGPEESLTSPRAAGYTPRASRAGFTQWPQCTWLRLPAGDTVQHFYKKGKKANSSEDSGHFHLDVVPGECVGPITGQHGVVAGPGPRGQGQSGADRHPHAIPRVDQPSEQTDVSASRPTKFPLKLSVPPNQHEHPEIFVERKMCKTLVGACPDLSSTPFLVPTGKEPAAAPAPRSVCRAGPAAPSSVSVETTWNSVEHSNSGSHVPTGPATLTAQDTALRGKATAAVSP